MRSWQTVILAALVLAATGCNSERTTENSERIPAPNMDTDDSMNTDTSDDDWQKTWDARLAALEHEFGKSDDKIATSPVPIYLGGGADVLTFKHHIDGIAYVTAGLIGDGSQKKTEIGEYELMMCVREENEWTPPLLSQFAPYTFETALNPGETMDIAPAMPEGSTIAALLFVSYRQFKVNDSEAGTLLCIGITESELQHCQQNGHSHVLAQLKEKSIFPFTDTHRDSVIP